MNITELLEKVFQQKKDRGWEKLYWAIDIHGVILTETYDLNNKGAKFAADCIEALQYLSSQEDHVLILWSSSHKEAIKGVKENFKRANIKFDYFNENPECPNTEICDFKKKFYFNILLDDKAGFSMDEDWAKIKAFLLEKRSEKRLDGKE